MLNDMIALLGTLSSAANWSAASSSSRANFLQRSPVKTTSSSSAIMNFKDPPIYAASLPADNGSWVQPLAMPFQPPMIDPMFGANVLDPIYPSGIPRHKQNITKQFVTESNETGTQQYPSHQVSYGGIRVPWTPVFFL